MATDIQKIRLGAADSQILDAGLATQVDLGASSGGSLFTYKPTYFGVQIDQALPKVAAFRTMEELDYETNLPQESVELYLAAYSQPASLITTTAAGTLAAAATPTVANVGAAGAVTVSYTAVAYNYNGDAIPSAVGTTATANATLNATNYNNVAFAAAPAGAIGIKIIRTVGGAAQGLIATLPPTAGVLADTGLVATTYVASAVAPVTPKTDTAIIGNNVAVNTRTLDVTKPKNDGTTNHWMYHVFRCYASDQPITEMKRDKNSEYKVKMATLADMTAGGRLWQITEQY